MNLGACLGHNLKFSLSRSFPTCENGSLGEEGLYAHGIGWYVKPPDIIPLAAQVSLSSITNQKLTNSRGCIPTGESDPQAWECGFSSELWGSRLSVSPDSCICISFFVYIYILNFAVLNSSLS